MFSSRRASTCFSTTALVLALGLGALGAGPAAAQPPAPPLPGPESPPAPPLPTEYPAPAIASPAPAQLPVAGTDHQTVIGRWGIEARRLATLQRTLGQESGCTSACPVDLNALSLRRWSSAGYAYSFGLALGAGGGSSRPTGQADAQTWDTFFGVGPTVAASFLLASWKHLAVSASPGLDVVFFMPSGKGSKTFLFDLRGVIEGELHLGMIGLPEASVALSSGLRANLLFATKDEKPSAPANLTASKWSVGFSGPTSLWDLVTDATVRYYF